MKKSLTRETEISDLQKVMSQQPGRRFIWRQLSLAGIFSPCFTAEAEGARRSGLNLLAEIMSETPKEYLLMQQEAMQAEQKRKAEEKKQEATEAEDYQDREE